MTQKTRQEFISDKFFYCKEDTVEVNALDFIDLLIIEERQSRALKLLHDKILGLEVALECAKSQKHLINLRC